MLIRATGVQGVRDHQLWQLQRHWPWHDGHLRGECAVPGTPLSQPRSLTLCGQGRLEDASGNRIGTECAHLPCLQQLLQGAECRSHSPLQVRSRHLRRPGRGAVLLDGRVCRRQRHCGAHGITGSACAWAALSPACPHRCPGSSAPALAQAVSTSTPSQVRSQPTSRCRSSCRH